MPRRPWLRPKGRPRESCLRLGRVRAAPSSGGSSAMAALARRRRSNLAPVGPRAGPRLAAIFGAGSTEGGRRRCLRGFCPCPLRSSCFSLPADLWCSSRFCGGGAAAGWCCPGCWCGRCTGRPLPPHPRLQVRSAGVIPWRFGLFLSRDTGQGNAHSRLISRLRQVIFPVSLLSKSLLIPEAVMRVARLAHKIIYICPGNGVLQACPCKLNL